MSLPSGLDPDGLSPRVIVKNRSGAEQYRFESVRIDPSPEQDFKLSNFELHCGLGADQSYLRLIIEDDENQLTDNTLRSRNILIKPQWTIEFALGRNSGNLNDWFKGYVYDCSLLRPINNYQRIGLFAIGKAIRNSERLTILRRFQKKESDGLTPDDTDTNANASNLANELLDKTDHFPHSGLATEGFSHSGIGTITSKISQFTKHFNSINNSIQEIANAVGLLWGTDPATGDYFMRYRGTQDSGILVTNNMSALLTTGWNKDKLCILRNKEFSWIDTTVGYGFSFIHGVGGLSDVLDHNQTSANAALSLATSDKYAFPFTPTRDSMSKISMFLSRSASTTTPLIISIAGETTTPDPNEDDIRRRVEISANRVNDAISVSGDYFEQVMRTINEQTPLIPNNKFYLIIDKHPQVRIDYQTGTGTFWTLSGGTWSSNVGNAKFRTYHSHVINIICENTVAKKTFGVRELPIPLNDFPDENSATKALIGYAGIVGRKKRMFSPLIVSPPTTKPDLGKIIRVVDKFNGMDLLADLVAFDIVGSAYDDSARGTTQMTLHIEDLLWQ